jgi:subtilisin-like proprotein convertase family protein
MKHSKMTARLAALAVGAATIVAASAGTTSAASAAVAGFTQPGSITINDAAPASPNPSLLTVAGLPNGIVDVNVTLKGLMHSYPDDIDVMLVGPGGQRTVLLSDAGGKWPLATAVDLMFDDSAIGNAPDEAKLNTGSYKPTNYLDVPSDTFPGVLPLATKNEPAALSTFNNTNPNGTWRLFVSDDSGMDLGSLSHGWGLSITTVDPAGAPTLTSPVDGSTSLNGVVEFGGAAAVGSTVQIFDGNAPILDAVTVADSHGVYRVSLAEPASDGVHSYTAKATANDGFNNDSTPSAPVQLVVDKVAPTGAVTIDGGAGQTNAASAILGLAATDPAPSSGSTMMQFSNDGTTWSPDQAYATSAVWRLSSGDGPKTVFAQFRDQAGNISVATATIVLDTASPGGQVTINNGAAHSSRTAVTLGLAATDATSGVTQMRFSNDGTTWTAYEPYANAKSWSLRPGDGRKSVSAQFKDNVGNVSVATATIVLDTVRPKVVRTVPANRRHRASTSANITAKFSESMNRASMTRSSVRVVRAGTSKSIAGRVSYSSTLRTVTFNPTRPLAAGTVYRVVITAVRDTTGNPLDQLSKSGVQRMTWSFVTRGSGMS